MATLVETTVEGARQVLGFGLDEADTLARLRTVAGRAIARVQAYCGRLFTPTALTRVLDAPPVGLLTTPLALASTDVDPFLFQTILSVPTALLAVPDLHADPPPTITAFGTVLTTDEYQLLAYTLPDGQPAGHYVMRIAQGIPVSWYYGVTRPWQPYGAIQIAGTFGYDAAVPDEVAQACEMYTVRLWDSALRHYSRVSGNAAQGTTEYHGDLFNADITDQLDVYKLGATAEVCL